MSHPYHGPLSAYNSLMDRHLTGYFNNTRIKRHLQRAGLITRNGRILSEKEYRLNAMRRDHQKYIRECLAQAIFHKVLDMERHHQIEIKRKLESFARKERVQRTKVDHSKSAEEDTGPVFSPRPPTGPRSGLNRQMTTQVEGSDSSESASSPRPNTAPGGMQRPYRLRPLQGYSSYGNVPKTSSGSRHKQSSDDTEQHFSKGVDRDIWKLINTMDHPGEISPYRLPIINNFVMPAPPPPQKRPKHGASYSSRGRRFRPTTAPNEHEVSSKDPKKFPKPSLHSNVKITMIYLGKNVHLSFEDDDYRDEVKIFQQHCGGENLCVFKGRLLEGESFSLISRRHRGFPFSLTFFINGMQVDRLSSCCEYKHRKGARLGGRNGHFGFTDIEGASPCYRCIIAMGLDKKPLPPPKKTTEEMSDSEDEKDERKDDSAVEDDVSEQKSHVDDEKMEQRSPRTSSPYDAEKEADDTKKDMEYEEEGEDTNDETRVCTDTYEADDETKDEYDEDFEVEEEKSDEKHNEEGQAYDEVEEKSKSPSDDEKDDLEHEKESNKSSKLKVQTPDSQKDERDGHSESENEGDKQECKSVQEKIAEAMGQGESVESEPEASDTSTDEEDTFKRPFMAHKLTAENIIPETNELTAESNDVKDLEENSKIEALEETEKPEEQMTEENEMTADNTLSEEETRQEHLLNEDLKIELEQEKDEEEVIMDHSNIAEEPPQEVDEEDYEAFNDELLREALNEDLADEAELKNSNDDNEIGDLTDLTLEPIEDSEMAEEFRGIEGEKTTNEIKALEEETMEVSAYSSLNSMLVSHTEESTSNLDELNEKDEDLNSLKDHDELVSERDSTKEITENLLASSSSFANTNSADGPNQNQETGNSGNELLEKESDLLFTDQTSDGTAEDADSELNMEQQFEMPVVSSKSDPLSVSHIESEETVDNVDNENNLSSSYITEVKEALNNADISEDIKTKDDIQEEEISDIMASDKESNAPVTDAMNTETDTEMVMGEPDANPSSPEERKVFDNEEEITASGETSNVELTTEILESQENLEESMESKAEDDLDVMGLNNEQITEIPVAENDDQPDGGARTEQPIPNEELGNSAVEMAVEGISAEEMKRPANFVEGVGNVDEDKEGDFCDSEDKETTENAENMTSEGENASNKLIQDEEMVASDVRMTEHDVTDDVEETKEAVLMDPITDMKNVTDDKEDVSIDDFPNGNLESTAKDESVVENLEFTDGGTNNDHIATADRVEKEDISATANEKEGLPDVEIEDAPVENGSETEVVNLTDEGVVDTHSVKGEEIDNNEKETFSEGYFGDQELTNDTIGDDIDEHTESDMANIENTSKYALSEENAAIKNEEEIDNTATGESDLICEDEPKEESAVTHFSTADNISENDQIGIINHDNIEDQTKEEHESQVSNSTNLILNTEKDASEHDDSVVEAEVLKDASEHEDSAVEAEVLKDASEHEDSAVEAEVLKDASEHEDSVVEAEVLKDASEHEDSVVEAEVLKDASEHEDSAVEAEVLKDASEHEAETNTPKEESEEKEKDDGENGNSTDVTQVSNVIDGGKDLEKLDHDTEVEDNGKDINDSGTEIGQNNMLEPSAPDEIEIANVDAKISEPKEEENPEEKETSSATNEVTDQ
ncbi:glutamate-rich protein 3 isoform X3 [Pelobates fuscus]|uniref:glutamate-rich protein 3 isoform X3 n=1 Tax=Pelobates fuscus TaxID=191477 RepID=UPI002FE4E7DA